MCGNSCLIIFGAKETFFLQASLIEEDKEIYIQCHDPPGISLLLRQKIKCYPAGICRVVKWTYIRFF